MKVLHCCLAAFYNDNYSYQENVLPRMHKLQGHDVRIVASTEVFVNNLTLGYINPSEYVNEDGIVVHRIPYKNGIPSRIVHKLRLYKGLYEELCDFNPDFIFLHDAQFLSISDVIKYLKTHPHIKVNVDGHSDFGNSAKGFISKNILHKLIYRRCLKAIEPYVSYFLGTLPNRVDFFNKMYGIPKNKTKLLEMGADDEIVKRVKESLQREKIRAQYNIHQDSILIVSGGKFTPDKHDILNIMDAVFELSKSINIRMIVFGSVSNDDNFKDKFFKRCDGKVIQYVGWIKGNETYNYFEASDLVIFSGFHSVLWEQAVGQGKPCIFRYIEGQTHIDLGGNCLFLKSFSKNEVMEVISTLISNYASFKNEAERKGLKHFSYFDIAKRALETN